jgi:hypothetical protein
VDVVAKALVAQLFSHGLPGVIILGMAWWIWRLQNKLNDVQEQRVEDAFRLAKAANTIAGALDRNTQTLNALLER